MHFCDHGAILNLATLHEALSVVSLATVAAIDIIKYVLIKECFKVSRDKAKIFSRTIQKN